MNRALALVLVLPLGCAIGPLRGSDPIDALLLAGTAAVATAGAPPLTSDTGRPLPRDAPPPPGPTVIHVVTPDPAPVRRQPTTIDGWVIGEERGWGIPFAIVKITAGHNPAERVRADAEGRFHVPPPLAAGHYVLEVTDERWEGSAELEVVDGVPSNVRIMVRARPAR